MRMFITSKNKYLWNDMKIFGTYSIPLNMFLSAYHLVLHLPRGARSIRVCEMEISPSYLAVRDTHNHYYLTGDWRVSWPGKYDIAGTTFNYRRPYNQPEELWADGPIQQDIYIEVNIFHFISLFFNSYKLYTGTNLVSIMILVSE